MGEQTWKSDERRVAEILGGLRNPVTGPLNGRNGIPDVTTPRFAVEVKRRTARLSLLDKAFEQAEKMAKAAEQSDGRKRIPLVVLHYTGTQIEASGYAIMRLGVLARLEREGVFTQTTFDL